MSAEAFDCRMCGNCCQGSGGIVMSKKDQERLAAHLGLSRSDMLAEHAEIRNGKMVLKAGADGYCKFFVQDKGCGVHAAKPDICRAWPFFKGNLTDPVSLDLARDYCPGINADIDFDEFSRQGIAYLTSNGLAADSSDSAAANALKI